MLRLPSEMGRLGRFGVSRRAMVQVGALGIGGLSDILATVYRVLGVDPDTSFPDHAGRPIPLVSIGKPIAELF